MINLYTVGYEGVQLSSLLASLKKAAVDIVVDVREFPGSRRPGFSKTPLREALSKAGIDYRHERSLGAPKEIRTKLRDDGDYKDYFRQFDKYLGTQKDLLSGLVNELSGLSVALLCFEQDPKECHRFSVAREMGSIVGVEPRHLTPG